MLDYIFERAMFAYEVQCGLWTDFRDWINVVTAEKNTEVDKLESLLVTIRSSTFWLYLFSFHFQPYKYAIEMDFQYRLLTLLAISKVTE